MRLTERRKMEVNENRGRLCRKKLQGKIRKKKKNHQKEKDITGSVKRANHNKGSMIVSDPTELVQGRVATIILAGLSGCVWAPVSFMGQANTSESLSASGKREAKKKNHLKTRKSTSWHRRKRKGHCFICLNIV